MRRRRPGAPPASADGLGVERTEPVLEQRDRRLLDVQARRGRAPPPPGAVPCAASAGSSADGAFDQPQTLRGPSRRRAPLRAGSTWASSRPAVEPPRLLHRRTARPRRTRPLARPGCGAGAGTRRCPGGPLGRRRRERLVEPAVPARAEGREVALERREARVEQAVTVEPAPGEVEERSRPRLGLVVVLVVVREAVVARALDLEEAPDLVVEQVRVAPEERGRVGERRPASRRCRRRPTGAGSCRRGRARERTASPRRSSIHGTSSTSSSRGRSRSTVAAASWRYMRRPARIWAAVPVPSSASSVVSLTGRCRSAIIGQSPCSLRRRSIRAPQARRSASDAAGKECDHARRDRRRGPPPRGPQASCRRPLPAAPRAASSAARMWAQGPRSPGCLPHHGHVHARPPAPIRTRYSARATRDPGDRRSPAGPNGSRRTAPASTRRRARRSRGCRRSPLVSGEWQAAARSRTVGEVEADEPGRGELAERGRAPRSASAPSSRARSSRPKRPAPGERGGHPGARAPAGAPPSASAHPTLAREAPPGSGRHGEREASVGELRDPGARAIVGGVDGDRSRSTARAARARAGGPRRPRPRRHPRAASPASAPLRGRPRRRDPSRPAAGRAGTAGTPLPRP